MAKEATLNVYTQAMDNSEGETEMSGSPHWTISATG